MTQMRLSRLPAFDVPFVQVLDIARFPKRSALAVTLVSMNPIDLRPISEH